MRKTMCVVVVGRKSELREGGGGHPFGQKDGTLDPPNFFKSYPIGKKKSIKFVKK
jgi:hypothetical protein